MPKYLLLLVEENKMNILVFALLSDEKLNSKLVPLINNPKIENIILIRRYPLVMKKIKCLCPPKFIQSYSLPSEIYRIILALSVLLVNKIHIIMGIQLRYHGVYAYFLGKIFNIPIIQNIVASHKKIIGSSWIRRIVLNSDYLIVRGRVAEAVFTELGFVKERIFIIPNFFDFERLPKLKQEKKEYDLIYVGSLSTSKRLDILISIVERLKKKHGYREIKLAICGDGYLKEKLLQECEIKGVSDNVYFLGYKKDIYEFLNKSKIFVFTSEFEGLPMAIIEAMVANIPVVSSDISNIQDIIVHEKNSFLVRFGDIQSYCFYIDKLLNDKVLYEQIKKELIKFKKEKEKEYSLQNIELLWNELLLKISISTKNNFNSEK